MEKFKQLKRIKEIYSQGENIIKYLRKVGQDKSNSIEDILISYDFQAGSYIKRLSKSIVYKERYCKSLANIIDDLEDVNSIMEVGVGEATTLNSLLSNMSSKLKEILGFDISWSRVKFANEFLKEFGHKNYKLFTANLFEIPLLDNSVDVVYTSHSIEPNGGREEEALRELYRVTKKYLVLLEPSYEFANEEARQRMNEHGYVTNLYLTAKSLNFNIVDHRLFENSINPLNPTGLLIIKKDTQESNKSGLVCPITHTPLEKYSDSFLYSEETFLAYPVLDSIPCLLKDNSILASHLKTDYQAFKEENGIVINANR